MVELAALEKDLRVYKRYDQGGFFMGLRIRTNVPSLTAQRSMSENNANVGKSFEKLSSGYRINRASDDAAGLAISETLRGEVRGLNVAKRNANDAISMVQVTEGSMNEMSNILIRMRELSVQASTDTYGEREKGFLNKEYVQLADEIDRIANTTEFNGNKIFDTKSDKNQFVVQVGTHASAVEDNADTIMMNLEGVKISTGSLGIGKKSELGSNEIGDASPSREDIVGKIKVIDSALDHISGQRATLGSIQSRLDSAINSISISVENKETAKSRIKDVDFAEETAKMTQSKIMMQSNISVLAQANAAPEQVLSLLRN